MTTYHDTTGQTCTACVKVAASPICSAEQSDWVCTREPGHDSVHIACGARHGAAYWVKEPIVAPTAPVCCGPIDEDVAFWHARWHEAADQRDDRDAAAHAWKEHSRHLASRVRSLKAVNEAWDANFTAAIKQREDAWEQLEHRDRELATAEAQRDEAQRLAAEQIAEAQTEATEAVTRAEKAEREASDHRYNAKGWMKTSESWQKTAEEWETRALRAESENPRPLTADGITDEMVARARREWVKNGGRDYGDLPTDLRFAIAAALTEPPPRPEWIDAPAVRAWHKDDGRTEHDGTPGEKRVWSPDYKTTETWSTPSLRNVHWSNLVDVEPLDVTGAGS